MTLLLQKSRNVITINYKTIITAIKRILLELDRGGFFKFYVGYESKKAD